MYEGTCSVEGCPKAILGRGWCSMHYNRWYKTGSLELAKPSAWDRFVAKIVHDVESGCWLWTGAPSGKYGYCQFRPGGTAPKVYAHRWSYEHFVGTIPDGLQLDHLCRVTRCVNPAHLEPVTSKVNCIRAKQTIETCPQGHPYIAENIYIDGRGWRSCHPCRLIRSREWDLEHRRA